MTKNITVRFTSEQIAALKALAKADHRTMGGLIVHAVAEYLERQIGAAT